MSKKSQQPTLDGRGIPSPPSHSTQGRPYNASDFLEDSDDTVTTATKVPKVYGKRRRSACASRNEAPVINVCQESSAFSPPDDFDEIMRPHVSALLVSCRILRLSMETTFTASCLLHRLAIARQYSSEFLQRRDALACEKGQEGDKIKESDDWKWTIAACVLLACKTEEEPRRLRDLINLEHMVVPGTLSPDAKTSEDCNSSSSIPLLQWNWEPPNLDHKYWKAKEVLVQTEQNVLRWLAFDVTVAHPHRAVVLLLHKANHEQNCDDALPRQGSSPNADDEQDLKIVQQAWTYLNNAVFCIEALTRHNVWALASAALAMAREEQQPSRSTLTKENDTKSFNHQVANKTGVVSDTQAADARKSLEKARLNLLHLSHASQG